MSRKAEFWVVNISRKDVSIEDLAVRIPRGKSCNLLGKGYRLTEDEIRDSLTNGSLARKQGPYLRIRDYAPQALPAGGIYRSKKPRIFRLARPHSEKAPPIYSELEPLEGIELDQEFAGEDAEFADADRAPALSVEESVEPESDD